MRNNLCVGYDEFYSMGLASVDPASGELIKAEEFPKSWQEAGTSFVLKHSVGGNYRLGSRREKERAFQFRNALLWERTWHSERAGFAATMSMDHNL